MNYTDFKTETFRRDGVPIVADIGAIVEKFVKDHLLHVHVCMYDGNTRLGQWAREAILDTGHPVILFGGKDSELRSLDNLPDSRLGADGAFVRDGKYLLVRLDRLPFSYCHDEARNCGLPQSPLFFSSYRETKARFKKVFEGMNFSGDAQRLANSPDILNGVGFAYLVYRSLAWQKVVRYAMEKLGHWNQFFINNPQSQTGGILC